MLSFVQLDKPHIASDFWLIVFLFYKFIMHLFKRCKINRAFQISDGRIVFLFLFVQNFCILDDFVFVFTDKKHFLMYESLIK